MVSKPYREERASECSADGFVEDKQGSQLSVMRITAVVGDRSQQSYYSSEYTETARSSWKV